MHKYVLVTHCTIAPCILIALTYPVDIFLPSSIIAHRGCHCHCKHITIHHLTATHNPLLWVKRQEISLSQKWGRRRERAADEKKKNTVEMNSEAMKMQANLMALVADPQFPEHPVLVDPGLTTQGNIVQRV